ncbi:MAG: porin [Micavibrio aeruginosavorus]|uniref:Porin n=1 Tax=Micavibrio aeruginosavorus TaxID=349221 RepID=A0A2W5BZ81_9BACT|nr:MAG: porin [Micavibrio aeruginosavorus]
MKKILLCSAALVGVAFAAAPAMAQVDVTVGGHTKNYMGWADNDSGARDFDMLRESELHFNAEGTADNGLTYGFHAEMEADGGDDTNTMEESYLYLASSLGRVNLGSEDGAAYLLQVAAPSADANIDGLRQYINPFSTNSAGANIVLQGLDYANDATEYSEKVTYLSPNWAGFQFGLSYTPEVATDDESASGLGGFAADADGSFYEAAARYEGTFNNVGFAVGAGYGQGEESDDYRQWNVGADFDIGAFGIGAAYTQEESDTLDSDIDTAVLGADYTTGPFQFGVSYLNQDADTFIGDAETDRYAGGVVYTLTQGLTLRGSVQYVDVDVAGGDDFDGVAALGGVQFNF